MAGGLGLRTAVKGLVGHGGAILTAGETRAWAVRFRYASARPAELASRRYPGSSLFVIDIPKRYQHDANHPNKTDAAMPYVRAYLRASTDDQDAQRARQSLQDFAQAHGREVVSWYAENESGAKLDRPELFRLLADCQPGDVLLVEQVDRLSRLTVADWDRLKDTLKARGVRVVALDLPTSHGAMRPAAPAQANGEPDPTESILSAVNAMLLDMLAVMARKDYTDRRRRQAEGITKAKTQGLYKGRKVDDARHANILALLDGGKSWSQVQQLTGASRSTISRAVQARKEKAAA